MEHGYKGGSSAYEVAKYIADLYCSRCFVTEDDAQLVAAFLLLAEVDDVLGAQAKWKAMKSKVAGRISMIAHHLIFKAQLRPPPRN